MKVSRVAVMAAAISLILLCLGCGDTFRPVATPVTQGGGDAQNFDMGLVISQGIPNSDGTPTHGATSVVDTTGDTNIGNVVTANSPVHAVLLSGGAFIANRDSDTLTGQSTEANPTGTFDVILTDKSGSSIGPVFLAASGGSVYVAGFKSGTVPVVNASVNPPGVIASISVGDANSHPVAIATLPAQYKAYVLNRDAGNVKVISTVSNTVTATIGIGGNPVYALVNGSGTAVYVLSGGSSPSIKVIDLVTDSVTQTISLPGTGNPDCLATPIQAPCASMAYNSSLQRLYVANYSDASLSIFDASAATLTQVSKVAVGAGPIAVAPLANGSRVYTLNRNASDGDTCGAQDSSKGQISVLTTSNNRVVSCIAVASNPVWLAASGDSTKLLVPHRSGTPGTQVIATSTNSVVADVPAPLVNPDTTDTTRMTPVFVLAQ
jgi:YVTN family beta-propeller protein